MPDRAGPAAQVASRRAGGYSPGTRQRLTLAAALPGDPQVIVPDEPATGLDARGAGWLRRQIRHWAAAGRTVLAGHSLTELAPAADRVLVLDQGPIIGQAAAGELGPGAALSEALPGLLTAKPRTRP